MSLPPFAARLAAPLVILACLSRYSVFSRPGIASSFQEWSPGLHREHRQLSREALARRQPPPLVEDAAGAVEGRRGLVRWCDPTDGKLLREVGGLDNPAAVAIAADGTTYAL